jgi:hypothetical protein
MVDHFIDDNGVTVFVDDNGVILWIDDNGIYLGDPGGGSGGPGSDLNIGVPLHSHGITVRRVSRGY